MTSEMNSDDKIIHSIIDNYVKSEPNREKLMKLSGMIYDCAVEYDLESDIRVIHTIMAEGMPK